MVSMNASPRPIPQQATSERGFSILEAVCSIGIVSVGLLGLAAVFAQGMTQLGSSQSDLIAREKAAEAIESVYSARDSRVVTWAQLRNVVGESGADNGIFRDGPQEVRDPGPDGLVNTADDGGVQQIATPGADGQLGTADDEFTALNGFRREIEIRSAGPNIRQIRVILTFPAGGATRQYVLVGLMSSFS
jgi:hypothetical protein